MALAVNEFLCSCIGNVNPIFVGVSLEGKEKEKSQYLFTNNTSTQVDLGDESVAHYKHHTHTYSFIYLGP